MCAIKRPLKRHVQRELFNETPRTETIIKYTNIQIKYETKKKKRNKSWIYRLNSHPKNFLRKIFHYHSSFARSTQSKIKLISISPLIVPFFGVNIPPFPRTRFHPLFVHSITPHPPPPPPPTFCASTCVHEVPFSALQRGEANRYVRF